MAQRNIAVIGGGAAGMAAAIFAARQGAKVTLLERQARVGKKLSVTGNGRCNLTNRSGLDGHYHGDGGFAAGILSAFGPEETLTFFRELGLVTVTEPSGRVYPLSDKADSVVDVLRFALTAVGADTRCGAEVTGLRRGGRGFLLSLGEETLRFDRVILACGGAAGTKAGGGPSGYRLLKSLGHRVTGLRPSLVQLKTEGTLTRSLKGIRADASVRVFTQGRECARSEGEVQFTEYGLSGPAIFEVSRFAPAGAEVRLDLLRESGEKELFELLLRRRDTCPFLTAGEIFSGVLQGRLGRTLLRWCALAEAMPIAELTRADLEKLAAAAKAFSFRVDSPLGFDSAQVTAGGAETAEFDPVTLESRLVPGLWVCGELLNVDGDCGGYNLQWAWSSGRAAGLAAGRE